MSQIAVDRSICRLQSTCLLNGNPLFASDVSIKIRFLPFSLVRLSEREHVAPGTSGFSVVLWCAHICITLFSAVFVHVC